jgi:ABC-type amino acid transport substrate-binding protein
MPDAFRVGYEPDFPPLTFSKGGSARGLIVDLLRAVFERMPVTPEFIPVPLPQHEEAIARGNIESIAYKATVDGRTEIWSFSDPLLTTGIAWFPPTGAPPPPYTKVATPARGPLIGMLAKFYPGISVVGVDDYRAALRAAADGRADAAALNFHVGTHLAQRDFPTVFDLPTTPLRGQEVAFAVPAGDPDRVLPEFNKSLSQVLRRDGLTRFERNWLC